MIHVYQSFCEDKHKVDKPAELCICDYPVGHMTDNSSAELNAYYSNDYIKNEVNRLSDGKGVDQASWRRETDPRVRELRSFGGIRYSGGINNPNKCLVDLDGKYARVDDRCFTDYKPGFDLKASRKLADYEKSRIPATTSQYITSINYVKRAQKDPSVNPKTPVDNELEQATYQLIRSGNITYAKAKEILQTIRS